VIFIKSPLFSINQKIYDKLKFKPTENIVKIILRNSFIFTGSTFNSRQWPGGNLIIRRYFYFFLKHLTFAYFSFIIFTIFLFMSYGYEIIM